MIAVAVAAAASGPPATVAAATSVESGWWSSSPLPVGADVGEEQLLVQGGAAQPLAYAGVSFTLMPEETPETLVLAVAPESATTPGATLTVCLLTEPASSASGAPASEGPPPDCSISAEVAPSDDGTSYEADVAPFAGDGALHVAVLPTQPSDRVVLERPRADALRSSSPPPTFASDGTDAGSSGSGSSGSGSSGSGFDAGSGSGFSSSPSGSASSGSFSTGGSSFQTPAPPAPSAPSTPTEAPVVPSDVVERQPEVQLAAPAASQRSDGGNSRSLAPFLFAGLAASAAALWAIAGREEEEVALDGPGS